MMIFLRVGLGIIVTCLAVEVRLTAANAPQCLPDAVPASLRKDLQSEVGSFPLGLWVNGNPHDVVSSAVFQLLAEEVLGINVFVDPRRKADTKQGYYALAGCEENASSQSWSCEGRESRIHVMLGAYMHPNNDADFELVQRLRVGGILDRPGTMGYNLFEGLHVPQAVLDRALAEHGLGLEYFRSYAGAGSFNIFAKIADIDPSDLMPCADWGIYSPQFLDVYLQLTGADVRGAHGLFGRFGLVSGQFCLFAQGGAEARSLASRKRAGLVVLGVARGFPRLQFSPRSVRL